jgi:hypothetical protein
MAKRLTVVVSQGQSANPAKRQLEEDIVAALLLERGVEVTVIPHLYDLPPDGTGMLCLRGIAGDMVVLSWLYPRAAHWILARNHIQGQAGRTLLVDEEAQDASEQEEDGGHAAGEATPEVEQASAAHANGAALPSRKIYCLDLRVRSRAADFVQEIKRIMAESSVQTVDLLSWVNGTPRPEQLARYLSPGAGEAAAEPDGNAPRVVRIAEEPARRWYPVIDFSRCTNCMECLDFCLFGVYGVDKQESILVEQPDNCRKGCPACSRVCPENAIIFPQHKTPVIAGSSEAAGAGSFKIDLSKLFGGGGDPLEVAARERDEQLVAAGRQAVGATVGMPKRQQGGPAGPKDDLDKLIDDLDALQL